MTSKKSVSVSIELLENKNCIGFVWFKHDVGKDALTHAIGDITIEEGISLLEHVQKLIPKVRKHYIKSP